MVKQLIFVTLLAVTMTSWAGDEDSCKEIEAPNKVARVFVLAGQSNAIGLGIVNELAEILST